MTYELELKRKQKEAEAKAREEEVTVKKAAEELTKEVEANAQRLKADALLKAIVESGESARRELIDRIKDADVAVRGRKKEIDRFIVAGELPGPLLLRVLHKIVVEKS